jgi:hypothetical protein
MAGKPNDDAESVGSLRGAAVGLGAGYVVPAEVPPMFGTVASAAGVATSASFAGLAVFPRVARIHLEGGFAHSAATLGSPETRPSEHTCSSHSAGAV